MRSNSDLSSSGYYQLWALKESTQLEQFRIFLRKGMMLMTARRSLTMYFRTRSLKDSINQIKENTFVAAVTVLAVILDGGAPDWEILSLGNKDDVRLRFPCLWWPTLETGVLPVGLDPSIAAYIAPGPRTVLGALILTKDTCTQTWILKTQNWCW